MRFLCKIFGHFWKYSWFSDFAYRECKFCKCEQSSFMPKPHAQKGIGFKNRTLVESASIATTLKQNPKQK